MTRAYDNAVDARYPSGRRNLIINGAMEVAQRGTSFSNISADTYVVDRFYVTHGSATPDVSQQTVTVGGETGLPLQFTKYARADFNVSGGSNFGFVTRLEDTEKYIGTHVLSFYAKGTNPTGGECACRFLQRFGSGGSSQVINDPTNATFTVTSEWQRFEISVTLPSVSGKTLGTGRYLQIQITQPNGDSGTDTFTLDITGVQFEAGNVATPFEHRSYGEELALCQRYYYLAMDSANEGNTHGPIGCNYRSNNARIVWFYPQNMRSAPSLTFSGTLSIYSNDQSDEATSFNLNPGNNKYAQLSNDQISATAGHACFTYAPSSDAVKIEFDAEL